MALLPDKTNFTDSAVTEGGFKAAMDQLRDYLAGLLGTEGTPEKAREALGLGAVAVLDAGPLYAQWLTGSGEYVVPDGVYRLRVDLLGAGGGGAGNYSGDATRNPGGGGAGGEWRRRWLDVTPGQVIAYECGAGGNGGGAGANGQAGGNTTFGALVARGGRGGTRSSGGATPTTPGVVEHGTANGSDSIEFGGGPGGGYGDLGSPGAGGAQGGNGGNASGYAAGGGGAGGLTSSGRSGGDGVPGLIIVTPVLAAA